MNNNPKSDSFFFSSIEENTLIIKLNKTITRRAHKPADN